MSAKFKGKYRNESARLQNWDYGSDAAYFITICTNDRAHFFGEIQHFQMQVSPAGAIAYVLWNEIKNHAQNVELGEFVVMPNHVHGILILNNGRDGFRIRRDVARGDVACRDVACRDVACNVPTDTDTDTDMDTDMDTETETETNTESENGNETESLTITDTKLEIPNPFKNEQMATISPKSNTVSTIIRSYKSAVTKYCNRLGLPFAWQSRFHDHIIRNEESFHRISAYIKNNPANWKDDKFY